MVYENKGKPFWKSKTLWFNLLFLVVYVAQQYGFAEFIPSDDVQNIAIGLVAVINIVLRIITKEPVKIM